MKVKPKEVLLNLPVALLFDEPSEVGAFAANVNAILHGKVRLKAEELGTLGGRYVGLFYLQRNLESQEIHDEFVRLIEQEEVEARGFVPEPEMKRDPHERQEDLYVHVPCTSCEEFEMLHMKGDAHCRCGENWNDGMCDYLRRPQ